ncbi:hypothetical protein PanWU01x14_147640 [Parasponia andersonii]|uniref:Transmembrane protein n=1 Tax=Parasponia andersonii TaxID=3476 RepID=A0A2P5CJH0_PARAD|nr:hypothetical protein PanWU01x14_147640 [Parasponia andersonii]
MFSRYSNQHELQETFASVLFLLCSLILLSTFILWVVPDGLLCCCSMCRVFSGFASRKRQQVSRLPQSGLEGRCHLPLGCPWLFFGAGLSYPLNTSFIFLLLALVVTVLALTALFPSSTY